MHAGIGWHCLFGRLFFLVASCRSKGGELLFCRLFCTLFGLINVHGTMAANARELIRHACAHLLHYVCVLHLAVSRLWLILGSQVMNGFVIVSLAVLPLAAGYALYWQYACRAKALDFFPCHYKTEAGTFARLLQMVLTQLKFPSGSQNWTAWFDSDV